MIRTIFIIHGIYGSPEENWFPWLKKELESLSCKVIVPKFPNPANPRLVEWMDFLEEYKEDLNPEAIVVGHSLGVAFLLSVLEKYPVKAAFFVASVTPDIKNEFSWQMKSFINKKMDWEKIKKNCKNFFIYNSDNDPYIPLSEGKKLAKNLETRMTVIKDAGHINSKSGFTSFEPVLEDIKKIITKDL